jgi:hypothetical protein
VAVVDDVDAIGERHSGGDVLLDDQDGLVRLGQAPAGGEEIARNDRRQTLERLVEQQDLRCGSSIRSEIQASLIGRLAPRRWKLAPKKPKEKSVF